MIPSDLRAFRREGQLLLGFVLMLPLAITSTNGMIKRMGSANWNLLHKRAYIARTS